jgi:Gram-negative bacterial TonB protein C-terminal
MPARGLLIALLFLTVSPQAKPRYPVHVESLVYPSIARQSRLQGDAVLVAQIASDGSVSIPLIKSGHPMFVHVAEENLKKWKFQVGEDQQMEITYHFKFGEKSSRSPVTECQFDLPNSVTFIVNPPPILTIY